MPMYARGSMAKALCMRCGLKFLLPELVMDGYYPNIRVCTECYDPPQPQEKLAIVSDPTALWRPSPDTMAIKPPFLQAQPGAFLLNGRGEIVYNDQGNPVIVSGPGYLLNSDGTIVWNSSGGPVINNAGSPPATVALWWVGFNTNSAGLKNAGANITAGFNVMRSSDGQQFETIITLLNLPDEFGAYSIEQTTYVDTPPGPGTWYYKVLGYDVLFNAEYGA